MGQVKKFRWLFPLIICVIGIGIISVDTAYGGRIPLVSTKWSQLQWFDVSVYLKGPTVYRMSLFGYSRSCFTGMRPLGLGSKIAEVSCDNLGLYSEKRFLSIDKLIASVKIMPIDVTFLLIGWGGKTSEFHRSKFYPGAPPPPPGYVYVTEHEFETISPLFYLRASICPWTLRRDGPLNWGSQSRKMRLSQTLDLSLNLAATTVASWNFEASIGYATVHAPSKWNQSAISDATFYVKLSTGFGAFSPRLRL